MSLGGEPMRDADPPASRGTDGIRNPAVAEPFPLVPATEPHLAADTAAAAGSPPDQLQLIEWDGKLPAPYGVIPF